MRWDLADLVGVFLGPHRLETEAHVRTIDENNRANGESALLNLLTEISKLQGYSPEELNELAEWARILAAAGQLAALGLDRLTLGRLTQEARGNGGNSTAFAGDPEGWRRAQKDLTVAAEALAERSEIDPEVLVNVKHLNDTIVVHDTDAGSGGEGGWSGTYPNSMFRR